MSSCLQAWATEPTHGKPRASGCQPGHSPPPSLPQVAEIHRASKDGQLYDVGGGTSSCSAQAEPPEPAERDTLPASQVYPVSGVLESAKPMAPRPLALAPPGNTALTLALPCSGAPTAPLSPARPPSLGLPSLAFPGPHAYTWTRQRALEGLWSAVSLLLAAQAQAGGSWFPQRLLPVPDGHQAVGEDVGPRARAPA